MVCQKPKIVIITGPTGSGKSELAVNLCCVDPIGRFEIVTADSRQIYKGMDIGTDKPDKLVRESIPHHMIDVISPSDNFSAADYAASAGRIIESLWGSGKVPMIVGGTGLYIRALIHGLVDLPGKNPEIRQRLREEMAVRGIDEMYNRLIDSDHERAAQIKPNDSYRILRALEIIELTGQSVAKALDHHSFSEDKYDYLLLVLSVDREKLYTRINERVDRMIDSGLFQEVRMLMDRYGLEAPGLKTIGYQQIAEFFGQKMDRKAAVEEIKRDTRRYAKRQLTWFRKEKAATWIHHDPQQLEVTAVYARSIIQSFLSGSEVIHDKRQES